VHETQNSVYLITELCEGGHVINQGGFTGHLTMDQINILLIALLDVVKYIHGKRILHRDIKPENILVVDREGLEGPGQVRVIDFGLACGFDDWEKRGSVVGTLGYVAPEVLEGLGGAGGVAMGNAEKLDIFSLGATFYKFITGKIPFEKGDAKQLFEKNR
jgi:serine/threonine protein kinase